MLLDKVRKTVRNNILLENGDTVLCAVSGGADSVCLLHVIQELKEEYNLNVCVANVNHLIRGEESDRDSNFVKDLCEKYGIKCFYREYDVVGIAKQRKIGEEECGRILRYEFFEEVSHFLGKAKIATAHNLNDNAETVLFRLARGTGARGLSGIKYKRNNIIRPLLDVSRQEIEEYLKCNNINWCEDSTNKIPIYNRNKLRLSVLPLLNDISSKSETHIVSAAKLISEDDALLSEMAMEAEKVCFLGEYLICEKLLEHPVPVRRRIAADILSRWGVNDITCYKVESFLDFSDKESGKRFDISAESYAEKSYGRIYLRKRGSVCEFSAVLDDMCINGDWKITVRNSSVPTKRKNNNTAVFDGDKLSPPFLVRYKKEGDRMSLKGIKGTKKLSDIFSDEKTERYLRNSIPVVEKDGEILFLCGIRQSGLYAADNNTKNYLIIEYEINTNDKI